MKLEQSFLSYDSSSLLRSMTLLSQKFDEYIKIKNNSVAENAEISKFQAQLQEYVDKKERIKNDVSEMSKNVDKIIGIYNNEYNAIKKTGIDIESEYYSLIKEWDVKISLICEQ